MRYSIANIEKESTAEVEGHISDIIYFNGCLRDCCYCFNKELKEYKEENMSLDDIIEELSPLSDTAVLTGGEPLHRSSRKVRKLIQELKSIGKKVILETSVFDDDVWGMVDHVLYTAKTFSWKGDMREWSKVYTYYSYWLDIATEKFTLCVVTDHPCFDEFGYKILKELFQNEIKKRGAVNGDY